MQRAGAGCIGRGLDSRQMLNYTGISPWPWTKARDLGCCKFSRQASFFYRGGPIKQAQEKRRLILIPVIHSQADLGELGATIREHTIREQGREAWERKVQSIDRYWDAVEAFLFARVSSFTGIRIFQDGLPLCGHESNIVKELADSGSRNHKLVLRLVERGAVIMGTESPDLVLQEYQNIKQGLEPRRQAREEVQGMTLLERRDRFIGRRINTSLDPGQTGILFLGMLHAVRGYLQRDILVLEFQSMMSRAG